MVGNALGKGGGDALLVVVADYDVERAATFAEGGTFQVQIVGGELVETAYEGAGVIIDLIAAFLEAVELLEYGDGQVNVVVLEVLDGGSCVRCCNFLKSVEITDNLSS